MAPGWAGLAYNPLSAFSGSRRPLPICAKCSGKMSSTYEPESPRMLYPGGQAMGLLKPASGETLARSRLLIFLFFTGLSGELLSPSDFNVQSPNLAWIAR